MRRSVERIILGALFLSLIAPAGQAKKKNDAKLRLQSLETIDVSGRGLAADYVRRKLDTETCLKLAPSESAADARLEIDESTRPCPESRGMIAICRGVSARLYDGKTGKLLLYREDDSFPMGPVLGAEDAPGKWVLWNLKNACCKNRPAPASQP